jgi:hypothetical protein
MISMFKKQRFDMKSLAAACCVAAGLVALPAHAVTEAKPPAINIDSHELYFGNTGASANTRSAVDVWDTFGYALSVFNPDASGAFTDYIVQRVQGFTPGSGGNPGEGFSIGVALAIDGTLRAPDGTRNPYDFTNLRYFKIFLQNESSGVITSTIDINNLADIVSGLRVMTASGLTNVADPLSTSGGEYGTNAGFTGQSVYQGGFLQENDLLADTNFCVPDPAGGCRPFMTVGGVNIFDYIASLGYSQLIQMSSGNIGTPDETVKELDGNAADMSATDASLAGEKIYDVFNSLGAWFGPITPDDPEWVGNVLVYTVAADPRTDFAANAVPEPATLSLIGLSLLGLGVARRRRTAA